MKPIETPELEIVRLFLEKLESLNENERRVIIETIQILNKPVFITT